MSAPPPSQKHNDIGTLGQKMSNKYIKTTFIWGLSFPEIVSVLKRKENQRPHRRSRAQKEVGKSEFSLELILCIVNTENRVLPKNVMKGIFNQKLGFEWKPHNLRINIRYIFNLALGPEEPSEVHFFEKCWIWGKLFSQKYEIWIEMDLEASILDETRWKWSPIA